MLYNKAETAFHKTAKRIKTNVQPLLDSLDQIAATSALVPPDEKFDLPAAAGSVGDLEPSLILLSSLIKPSTLEPEQDNLASLFAFQLEKPRPPTPPPPSPSKKPVRKHVTAEEKRRRWEEREAAAKERAAARATRATITANTDFAREAGYLPSDTEAHSRQISGESRSSRKSARSQLSSVLTEQSSDTAQPGEAGPSESRSRNRSQRGVAGLETVAILSDRERREQEKALDLVTEQVDEKDQFKRFNVGWVLPEGSKRRRAEKPDTLAVPRNGSGMCLNRFDADCIARPSTSSPLITTTTIPETTATYAPSSPLTSASSLTPPSSEAEEPEILEEERTEPSAPTQAHTSSRKRKAPDYPPTFGRSKKKKHNTDEPVGEAEEVEAEQEEAVQVEEGEEEIELLDQVEADPTPSRKTKGKGKEGRKKKDEAKVDIADGALEIGESGPEQVQQSNDDGLDHEEEDPFPPGTLGKLLLVI